MEFVFQSDCGFTLTWCPNEELWTDADLNFIADAQGYPVDDDDKRIPGEREILWRGLHPMDLKMTWTNRAGEKLVLDARHLKIHHSFIMSGGEWMSATWLNSEAEKLVLAHMATPHIIHDAQFSHFDGDSTDIDFEDGGNLLVEHIECL